LLASLPIVPVIGNHERANDPVYGYPNYRTVFPEADRFYVLEFPDVALFVVDSNFILDQNQHVSDAEQERLWRKWIMAPAGEDPAWLQRQLARHHQRFKIVAMHHPPVSIGRHHDDWTRDDYGVELERKRRELVNLFLDNGACLVLSGHEHIYQHTTIQRHDQGEIDDRVLHMVVTSGGGAPVRHLSSRREIEYACRDYLRDGLIVDLVRHESVYHYTAISVSGGDLHVDTYQIEPSGERPLLESVVIEGN
jgi:hypothetical protein